VNTNGGLTHPIHMHGLMFHVLEIGSAADRLAGKMQRPYDYRANPYPAMKDTVAVPSFGYAKIRFRATNPGMTELVNEIVALICVKLQIKSN